MDNETDEAQDFTRRVVSGFQRSQGLVLAGAVAYDTLLAIVPLFVVLLGILSHVVEEHRRLDTVASNLQLVIPSQPAAMTQQVEIFLAHREVAIIFHHRGVTHHRHVLVSVRLPYVFVILIGPGVLLITVVSGALHTLQAVRVFGDAWAPAGLSRAGLYLLGMVGLTLLLTAVYMVLPVGQVRFGHALIGGVIATLLWEVIRHGLVWYFARLSMANVIDGPMAAVIVVLLTLEAAASLASNRRNLDLTISVHCDDTPARGPRGPLGPATSSGRIGEEPEIRERSHLPAGAPTAGRRGP